MTTNRPLKVFLCHSSADKPAVRELYQKLRNEPWIEPWLDEEELFPGMDWNMEIEKAIEATDVILVCLSNKSITAEGYVQREIRIALDYADYKPEGTLFIIPVRLEECKPPKRLARWQYADYFESQRERAYQRLLISLKKRSDSLGLKTGNSLQNKFTLSNGMEFMRVPAGSFLMGSNDISDIDKSLHMVDIPYDYWMSRFPVTHEQYSFYVDAKGISYPVFGWTKKKDHPVVNVNWTQIMEYCEWLNNLIVAELPSDLILRLPTESEWEKAARGTDGRLYPWGSQFDKNNCNTQEGRKYSTTPVGYYSPHGDSPYGCADMAGNVWELTHSLLKEYPYSFTDGRENENISDYRVLRGGCFGDDKHFANCAFRLTHDLVLSYCGFRICLAPPLHN